MAEWEEADVTVWVTCDGCGDVSLRPDDIDFTFDADDGGFAVRYRCACGRRDVVAVTEPGRLGALFGAGLVPRVARRASPVRSTAAGAVRGRAGAPDADVFRALLAEPGRLEAEVARLRAGGT